MKKGLRVALMVFLFVWVVVVAGKADASTCYIMYYDDNCTGWDYTIWDYFFLATHNDGTFDDEYGDWGYWEMYGSSMHLSYQSWGYGYCYPFFAGTKKQGFYQCLDGSAPIWPACWYLKKTKSSNCWWMGP